MCKKKRIKNQQKIQQKGKQTTKKRKKTAKNSAPQQNIIRKQLQKHVNIKGTINAIL